ncbi:hypothetical protein KBC89_01695 [Candidatus Woesebacteria bacterium]|nr:hypothetical protein [Candidatus Woesebacteria bacterium]
MKENFTPSSESGYMLTALLVFLVVIIVMTTTSVMVSVSSLRSETYFDSGSEALSAADSGAENAILRLLRDPTYSGEMLTVGNSQVVITVTGSAPQVVTVVADSGSFERTVEVRLQRVDGMLQVTSWKEL